MCDHGRIVRTGRDRLGRSRVDSVEDPTDEAARAADLRQMKARAGALLLAVSAAFVVLSITTDDSGWAGYAKAAAEAAMVGGVADWFAVTALFRHPLRIPIPHTAIIPNRKDQIGASLGTFVQDNFLNSDLVIERVQDFEPAQRLGIWMTEPANAAKLGDQASAVLSGMADVLNDDEVASGLEAVLLRRLEAVPMTPVVSKGLEVAVDGGHHQAALDTALKSIERIMVENDDTLRRRLYDESPWWVPEAIDDRVFDKIRTGVSAVVGDVLADPNHEIRHMVDGRLHEFAQRLRESPDLAQRGEDLKTQLLDHPEVRAWLNSMWEHLKSGILEAADDPASELRRRLEAAIVNGGRNLVDDPALRAKVDRWIEGVVRYALAQGQGEVADLISSTVQRWDAQQTSERLELQVGRDLQFIRINGTIVGGLVGLAIHALAGVL